jgi:hypothetical protein
MVCCLCHWSHQPFLIVSLGLTSSPSLVIPIAALLDTASMQAAETQPDMLE